MTVDAILRKAIRKRIEKKNGVCHHRGHLDKLAKLQSQIKGDPPETRSVWQTMDGLRGEKLIVLKPNGRRGA